MEEFTALKYNLLSDYSEAKFNESSRFSDEVVEFMFKIKEIEKGKKQAIIIDDPYSTALSLIFENDVNIKIGFKVKVFSSKSAGLNWLLE